MKSYKELRRHEKQKFIENEHKRRKRRRRQKQNLSPKESNK